MRFSSILPVVLAALAYADTSTSVASSQTCITKYRPAVGKPSSLPTRTKCSSQTVTSITTTCGTKSTMTTTITPEPITITANGTCANQPIAAKKYVKRAADGCSTTTTVSISKTTVYTGTYNATVAKRTASPLDRRYPPVHHERNAFRANVFHFVGQRAVNAGQKAVAVDCLEQVTTYLVSTSTVPDEPATVTETASTPTIYVTPAIKAVSAPTAPVSITSTITAPGVVNATGAATCTVTAASSTTTQHIKCAPTNLIGEVNGYGIGQTGGDSANTRGLAPGSDPSACCQLCMDDDECAASEDDSDAGNCFLWYTQPSCGLGFQYSDGGLKIKPGEGFLVQTGCGTIEATDDF